MQEKLSDGVSRSILIIILALFQPNENTFLRKNIWQPCLFLPNSIKICREQKDLSARFSDKSETAFLGAFTLLALKMSAVPPNFSRYEILQSRF